MYMKPFRSAEWWICIFQRSKFSRNSISRHFSSQNPKCRFIRFQYIDICLCAKLGDLSTDLKPTIDDSSKRRPQILDLFMSKAQKQHSYKETAIFFRPSVSYFNRCAAENSKPRVMLRAQRGDKPSKIWENLAILSDSARILAFSSQRHTIWS